VASSDCAVLVDTNVILEEWRVRGWKALASRHALETVGTVVMETHTGYQRRRDKQAIRLNERSGRPDYFAIAATGAGCR
jgi:hypothetical protein